MSKILKWCGVCLLVFMISIFLHECGHGLSNAIAGIPCSTGFNRVGDIGKYPYMEDFREEYSGAKAVLLDFGVPCTLLLTILGAVLFAKSEKKSIRYIGAALAAANGMLRLIPCLMVLLTPVFTGNVHVEDEYETGQLLVEMTQIPWLLYFPAILSLVLSLAGLLTVFIVSKKRSIERIWTYARMILPVFAVGMILANVLDRYIRINWRPLF